MVGPQKGHMACRKLGVALRFISDPALDGDDLTGALHVYTTSIILSSNRIQTGDIPVSAYPNCPGKRPFIKSSCVLED